MSAARPTLLVVEDEPEIRRFLRTALEAEGYRVAESPSGRRALIDARSHKVDVALIDLGLPDMDGAALIRAIREWSAMPIVVLSARSHERSKIEALDAGADDYVTKPFAIGEMFARVRAAVRRTTRSAEGDTVLRLGDVVVDLQGRTAMRQGAPVALTPIEFRLLAALARHVGRVATHRALLTEVWGPDHAADTHYLRIYMKQLRDKLERDPAQPAHLRTEPGVGYRLVAE